MGTYIPSWIETNVSRPQRRTALIANELSRYNINRAAISETLLAEEGSLTESDGGYTFFWKGEALHEDRIHGVGFVIKPKLLKQIPSLPTGVNARLMKLCLPISKKRFIAIISMYAPTMTCSKEIREQFYANLDTELRDTPATDKVVILGDLNARVGRDVEQWRRFIGKHGVGKMNSNGFCC